ncbi:related to polyketide synthase [Phialocephala subalpina]|uniref:Related to polyketide synthase n=1 Tax=Phialocephala subalpina TaxID=576137 RepID=A0A1L7X593_9HELO|nr:related to polyketide synthase [Phialocephala subalpina]
MASPILFFGDGSLCLHPSYKRVLQSRKVDSLLSTFLTRARLALQYEITKIPVPDRKGMPDLAELEALIQEGSAPLDHQCLAPAMLAIIQLGQFISYYEARPEEPYPSSEVAITVGLCVGQLSAIAVSQARSLVELIPLAVESVRIAFRTGVIATEIRDELEQQSSPSETWAMTVPTEVGTELETIHKETVTLERKKAYVSASFRKAVTVQGPPTTLDKIDSWLNSNRPKAFRQRLPIYTPYHAPHLYSQENISKILEGSETVYSTAECTGAAPRLISPVTGKYYSATNRRAMLESVLYDVLKEPIQWADVSSGCAQYVAAAGNSNWVIKPFGPTLVAGSLASGLKIEAKVEATIDDFFNPNIPDQMAAPAREPIAIVGMAGRFPEAMSHDELWKLLEDGVDACKVIPADRFDADIYVSKDGPAKNPAGTPYGCFMKQPGLFDARLFNMSPREAEQTDPQQRLILTTAYEALEMSGFVPNRTPSTQLERIGTYYGQTGDEYREINAAQDIQTYYISGNDRAFGPGRINHYFKFGGPSMSVDTACSSSAVALNVACTAIWANECSTALVGGMMLLTSPDNFCGLSRGHFLNTTGNCKTFDDKADGYCRGEAVATVVIKRLSDAKADNDNILAVILGAGTNYSAASASITHPHGPTQEVLYKKLLNEAGLHPFDIDFVELHGTGTQAGDAAEMSSVSNVFAPATPQRPVENPLWLSSVKANIGHGESSSGVTALIKTLLVLREETVPKHVGIKSGIMNHTFPDFEQRRIKVAFGGHGAFPRTKERKRRALVNNFGAAGGNTALLIEEAPEKVATDILDTRSEHVINVAAKTMTSIKNNIKNLIEYLERNPATSLSDLSYTTTARRMQQPMKVSVTASSVSELKDRLAAALASESFKQSSKTSNIIFTFTGQGSLYLPLAKDLYVSSKQFSSDINRFNQICLDQGFPSFLPVIDGSINDIEMLSPAQTQLAICAVQMSLYRLWSSWGVNPTAVIGHSLGEYAALFACGVVSANDALFLVGLRACILEATCTQKTHCMLSIHLKMVDIEKHLGSHLEKLEVACINGSEDIVLSGAAELVKKAQDLLKAAGVKCTTLNTPYAFHSAQVDPILDDFETAASSVKFMKPRIPLLSPLLATVIREVGVVGPSYLRRHAREAVNFHQALLQAEAAGLANKETVWLELGPNPVNLGMVRSTLGTQIRAMPSLRKNESAWTTSAKAMSFFYTAGVEVNFNEYHRDFAACQNLLTLPTYAFEEKNYWLEYKNDWLLLKDGAAAPARTTEVKTEPTKPITTTVQRLVSTDVKGSTASLVFETDLSEPNMHNIIAGHCLNGLAMTPAGVYADMALTVGDYIRRELKVNVDTSAINVADMEILGSIIVPVPRVATPQLFRISATANLDSGRIDISFGTYESKTDKTSPKAHCHVEYGNEKAWLHQWSKSAWLVQKRIADLERGVNNGTVDKMTKKMAYQLFSSLVVYGAQYQGMQEVLVDAEELEATATLKLCQDTNVGDFFASPLWIDNLAQLSGFVMNSIGIVDPRIAVYISHGWGSMQVVGPLDPRKPYRVHVKMQPLDKSIMAGDVTVFQGETVIGVLGDVKFQRVPRGLLDTMLSGGTPGKAAHVKTITAPAVTKVETKKAPAPKAAPKSTPKRAPVRDSPMTKILELMAEEIGVPTAEMTDDSVFEEMGVDSLLSLTILSKIREALGMDLSPSTFQECETVGDLRRSLGDSSDSSSSSSSSSSDDEYDVISETSLESGVQTPAALDEDCAPVDGGMVDVLHEVIAGEVGVDIEELIAIDDLSSLGVDSLMSLTIVAALRERLGIDIPSHLLEECTSLKAMKESLNLGPAPEPIKAVKAEPKSKKSVANSMLLQGQAATATKTLFLFPDGSGSATSYTSLPLISDSTLVYAINSPFLKTPEQYTVSLESASALMVDELRSRQPHGPYLLAGWSAGGMYAYEAARLLISQGETISKLILIDSPCRTDYGPMPHDVLNYVSKSGVISGATGTAPQWLVDHFQGTIRAVREYAPTPFEKGKAPKTYCVWAQKGVFEDWPKAELAGLDLTDAVASWLLKPKTDPGSQGWEKLLGSGIECVSVDGNHFSMVHPPNCNSLSRAIGDAMEDDASKRVEKWRTA